MSSGWSNHGYYGNNGNHGGMGNGSFAYPHVKDSQKGQTDSQIENKNLKNQVDSLLRQLTDKNNEIAVLKKKNNELKSKLDSIEKKPKKTPKEEKSKLKEQNKSLTEVVDSQLTEISRLKDENLALSQKLTEYQKKTTIYSAVIESPELFKMMIEKSPENINEKDEDGNTVLILAAKHNKNECVEFLIGQQTILANEQNKYGNTALNWAAFNGNNTILEILLQSNKCDIEIGDYDNRTPLYNAVCMNHLESVKILVKYNAKVSEQIIKLSENLHFNEITEFLKSKQ